MLRSQSAGWETPSLEGVVPRGSDTTLSVLDAIACLSSGREPELSSRKAMQATELIFSLEKANPAPPSYIAISETLKIIGDRNGARFWAARGLRRFPRDRQLQALLRG